MLKKHSIKRITSLLMSFIFAFTLVFSMNVITAKAAETNVAEETRTKLFIKTSDTVKELYFAIWNGDKTALSFVKSDGNEYSDYFGWGSTQAKLKSLSTDSSIFSIELSVDNDGDKGGGFGIYPDAKGSEDTMLLNSWEDDNLKTLVSYKGKPVVLDLTDAKNPKFSDDLKSFGITGKDAAFSEKADTTALDREVTDEIRGMDISSYISIQDAYDQMNKDAYNGKKDYGFKDFDGNIIRDQAFFDFLAKQGMNWARIRIWNNPYDANGNGYGGGNNDLAKAVKLGQWATKAGMKVLIDFHYSDTWADPSRQLAPKAWKSLNGDPDKTAAAVKEYTAASLKTLLDNGVNVKMVQVGNETNNGIAGVKASGNWTDNVDKVYQAGCEAVHEAGDGSILAVIHLTNIGTEEITDAGYLAAYDKNSDGTADGVDYDVFGTTYYPFWGGSIDNINSTLSTIARTYHKQTYVAETSYAYTLDDIDGYTNSIYEGNSDTGAGITWPYTVQGMAESFQSVINTATSVTYADGRKAGYGAFYWEGDWNALLDVRNLSDADKQKAIDYEKTLWNKYGCGWTSSYSGEYDTENADSQIGGAVIENESFFGADGKALDSIKAFDKNFNPSTIKEDLTVKNVKYDTSTLSLDAGIALTSNQLGSAVVYYEGGKRADVSINWSSKDIKNYNKARKSSKNYGKTYKISGTVDGKKITRKVKLLYKNLLKNAGFEDTTDFKNWTTKSTQNALSVERDSSNIYDGHAALKFWAEKDFTFTAKQTVTVKTPGIYKLSMVTSGEFTGKKDYAYLTAKVNGKSYTKKDSLYGWQKWTTPEVKSIKITKSMIKKGKNKVTITLGIKAGGGTWGTYDNVRFEKYKNIK